MITITHLHGDYDLEIVRDVPREYAMVVPDCQGAVVLDVGAHIGCFSALALNAGATEVYAIEPAGPSFELAVLNLAPAIEEDRCEVMHAGITADPAEPTITLRYFADGKSMAAAKTMGTIGAKNRPDDWQGRPYRYEDVSTVNFARMLQVIAPTVVKLDCEGLEYDCIDSLDRMPNFVRTLVVEWHKTSSEQGIQSYLRCTDKLAQWGFVGHKTPNLVVYRHTGTREPVGANQFYIRPIAYRR